MSVAQTHETAHQLYYVIREFKYEGNDYFATHEQYRDHIVGKLKFFIDLYADMNSILCINEATVVDNYYGFLNVLCPEFNDDDLSDVMNDYLDYLCNMIDSLFEVFDKDGWLDVDEVLAHVSSIGELNFQEHQFIMDCYYSTCKSYKIMQRVDDKLINEADYYYCRKQAAINDYCRENGCNEDDILVQEIK